jgi:N-acetylmuramate 1-kinase
MNLSPTAPPNEPTDSRFVQLKPWLLAQVPDVRSIAPASADASFRRYFRVTDAAGNTTIVMDAPPTQEDCQPFVRVAQLLREAGVHAPQVLAQDLDNGFLLLTDVGRQTFLDVINADNALFLFKGATQALIKWQLASKPNVLPPHDATSMQAELQLFPDWYVGKHLGKSLTPKQAQTWAQMCEAIAARALAQPRVYMHNDFMPRNLMVGSPDPAVLDFQDAVEGAISYDITSLYRDAFVSWKEEFVLDGIIRYWEAARKAGLPVNPVFGEFYMDCEWMGLQRHLRILGVFARIHYRDGKPKYLEDTPRFVKYVRDVAGRYGALTPLLRLLDDLGVEGAAEIVYAF